MLAAALGGAGVRCVAAGNIGYPLVDAAADDHEAIVAELSSFQLRNIDAFRARVAVLLNVAEDHLDWHGSFEAYGSAKARIFENQGPEDAAVYHRDCTRWVAGGARRVPFSEEPVEPGGAGVDRGWIVVPEGRVVAVERMRARGRPNLANAVAAAAAACAFGADPSRVGDALAAFEPQPHRMETVAEIGGVTYVNDSKATNPHATLAALAGLEPVVLIAGGRNKGLDLGALGAGAGRVRAVVAIGEAAAEIEAAFAPAGVPVERAASMEDALELAAGRARRGDTVLLSPACASFDMFTDYRARGESFRAVVKRMEGIA
jgi:UDP-N-acetylmuramoylalanine--D-glutamate ligase